MKNRILKNFKSFLLLAVILGGLQTWNAVAQPKQQLARAQRLATEGDKFYRQKDYRAAIERYAQAISLAPNYPYAHFSKGYSHYNLAEYSQAITDFNKAFEQGYKKVDIYAARWLAYYMNKDYDSALRDAQAGLQLMPDSVDFKLGVADSFRAKNDCRSALPYYKDVASGNSANADLYYFIALCHSQTGEQVEQGLAAIKAVEKGTKYRAESWELIGLALQARKKYDEAIKAYEQVLQERTDMPLTYTSLAEVYRTLGRYDEAINTVKRSQRVYPNDGNSFVSLSWYYSLSNRHAEAIAAAKNAIRMLPEQYMGYTNLCRAYNDTKQYALAIQNCNRALELSPGDGESNLYLARAFDFQGKAALATATYKKAVDGLLTFTQQNPEYADGFYLLGNAYFAIDQLQNAINAYKRALDLSPNFPKAIRNLGSMYVRTGKPALAREQYNVLRDLDADLAAKLLAEINGK